jgi:ABC-type bacteriocin/lantibiotic exporter with double-glycine peptidase domain
MEPSANEPLSRRSRRRRFFVPEVVQTSAMDCGPASLHCLLRGFGLPSSYARLQEACQVDLDGTSINTIERIATSLGLDAEQVMMPADHVTLPAAEALPALVVVRRDGMLHFLIAWRRIGPYVQVMDPARGRRWVRVIDFQAELHVHAQRVPASGWREWAGSEESVQALRARLDTLGVQRSTRDALLDTARADDGWRGLAALDATVRMAADLVARGRVRRGADATDLLVGILTNDREEWDQPSLVPSVYWSVSPDRASDEHLILRGAVLLRIRGALADASDARDPAADMGPAVPSSFAAALSEPAERPFADVWRLVARHGVGAPALLASAVGLAAAGAVFELLLLRGMLEWNQILSLREQRLVAVALVVTVIGALMLLDLAISDGVLRIGRRIETRLRALLLEKLPRLSDRYFRSRLVSDMALRAHSLEDLRGLPELATRVCRVAIQLVVTAACLTWLDLRSGVIAWVAVLLVLSVPLAMQRLLAERDLRLRVHGAALGRYYLDSLIGLIAARTHGAERALRRRHESRLVEWGRAGLQFLRGGIAVEALQLAGGLTLAAWIVLDFVGRGGSPGAVLLVVYWALSLPTLGRELATLVRGVPAYGNVITRIAEILDAPEEPARPLHTDEQTAGGVAIEFLEVGVRTGGRAVLDDVNLQIASGEHLAIVGRSGAGKSTLAGLLLGWNEAATGCVLVDGNVLDASTIVALRSRTAWVDPAVQLWNRSLVDNIRYSDPGVSIWNLGSVITQADLVDVLDRLPGGLQASLGEAGGLTSGGEGQRVRFARALLRRDARLVILDEPFRGLDRDRRRVLLDRAREVWRGATTICITHDIEDTLAFDRVVVVDGGTIVEDDAPQKLALTPGSVYRTLLEAEREVRAGLAAGAEWRRWRVVHGAIVEEPRAAAPPADERIVIREVVQTPAKKTVGPIPVPIARPVEAPRAQVPTLSVVPPSDLVTVVVPDDLDAFEPEESARPAQVVRRLEPEPVPEVAALPEPKVEAPRDRAIAAAPRSSRRFAAAAAVLLAAGLSFVVQRQLALPTSNNEIATVVDAPVLVSDEAPGGPATSELTGSVAPPDALVSLAEEVPPPASAPAPAIAPSNTLQAAAPIAVAPVRMASVSMELPAVDDLVPAEPPVLPIALAAMPAMSGTAPAWRLPDLSTPAELVGVTPALALHAGRGRMADDVAIRQVLFQYERSYDRLDASSAAAVWRGVDVRGLTRAFASLSQQDLSFDTCDLRIDDERATANCRGALTFVRRVGDPEPEMRRVSWTIGFENDEGRWLIASVSAR